MLGWGKTSSSKWERRRGKKGELEERGPKKRRNSRGSRSREKKKRSGIRILPVDATTHMPDQGQKKNQRREKLKIFFKKLNRDRGKNNPP